jgi:hypothetical protein
MQPELRPNPANLFSLRKIAMKLSAWLLVLVALCVFGVGGCGSDDKKKPNEEQRKKMDEEMKKAIEKNK